VGGIFFDELASADAAADFAFVRAVGEALLEVYPRLVARRKEHPLRRSRARTPAVKRGRYVEFNRSMTAARGSLSDGRGS
jgi:coproporphyrinogen III oxidase